MAVGAILGQRGIQSVNGVQSDTTGNVDLSAGTMTSGIDMNSQALTGLTTPVNPQDSATKQYVDNNSSPYNWLDNSDFTNLVAQAGIGGSHGNQAYAADRWILTNGSVSHQAGVGLTLNGTITQKLEHPPTGTVSAFVGMASGQASISYSGGAVTITSAGGIVAWAALYQGTYTEETMPEYRPKGYAAEFTECMRYYQLHQDLYLPGICFGGVFSSRFLLSIPMRLPPTVTIQGDPFIYTPNNGAFNAKALASNPSAYSVVLSQSIDVLDTIPANMPNITLQLSADL